MIFLDWLQTRYYGENRVNQIKILTLGDNQVYYLHNESKMNVFGNVYSEKL